MTDPVVLLSTGDVVGPNSSTDNTLVLFDGTSGKKVKGNNAVVTTQGLNLLDDVDATANRATIGLDQVNNTSDVNKPVSTPQQTALNQKINNSAATAQGLSLLGGADAAANRATIGLNLIDNTSDINKPVSTPQQTALNQKINNSAATTQGLNLLGGADATANRATIGLDQVNNTSDVNKPVSTPQQTALNLKFDKVGGTISGTANLANGAGDAPKVNWTTPFVTAYMNVYNDYVRVEATLNGVTLPTPLLLNLTSKSFSVFGRTVWDTGNFTPPVKSTASLATNGWSKDGDTGVIEQWMEVAMGDYASVSTLAITWPFQFPNQFFNARISFRMPNSTIGCASQASYSAATTSGCTLRIEEWTGAVQTGLVLVIEARGC